MSRGEMSLAHTRRQCTAPTASGKPCRMAPLSGSDRCFTHAPDRAPARARARKRGGKATRAPRLFPLPAEPAALRDVASIQVLLEQTVHETLAQRNGYGRSRALGSLLLIALRALDAGEVWLRVEQRLAALEAQQTDRPLRRA